MRRTCLGLVLIAVLLLTGCSADNAAGAGATRHTAGPLPTWTPAPHTTLPTAPSPPTPAPMPTLSPDGPFALVFAYGPCGLLYRLDTAADTYTRERVGTNPPVTRPLRLTTTELASIRDEVTSIGFFGYPEQFTGRPPAGVVSARMPAPVYDLTVRDGGRVHRVHWDETIVRPITAEAARLRTLGTLLKDTIAAHPEAQQLPAVFVGCA